MIKRISFIFAITLIALVGFTYLSKSKAETHEEEHEEVDFEHIPLSSKQVNAVDLKMGEGE